MWFYFVKWKDFQHNPIYCHPIEWCFRHTMIQLQIMTWELSKIFLIPSSSTIPWFLVCLLRLDSLCLNRTKGTYWSWSLGYLKPTPLVFTTDNTPCYPKNMFFLTQPFFQNMPDYSLANWATPVGVGHSIITSLRLTVMCSCGPTVCAVAVASVLVIQAFHNRTWVPSAKDPNTDNPTPHPGVPVTFVKLAGSFLIWQSWRVKFSAQYYVYTARVKCLQLWAGQK